jgi:hypothetical protein
MSKLPVGWRQVSRYRYERDDGAYVDGSEAAPFWRPGKGAVFIASESSSLRAVRAVDAEWPRHCAGACGSWED